MSEQSEKEEPYLSGYSSIIQSAGTSPYPRKDPSWRSSIGYLLRPNQQLFFNSVLPLKGSLAERNPRLVIGYGPPGSGKTVVGADLAIESVFDGHRVDILVPSGNLKDEYSRLLASGAVSVVAFHGSEPGIRVMRFEDYFADRAGAEIEPDREARILAWGRSRLDAPHYQARLKPLRGQIDPGRLQERLPVLIDALLEDHSWWERFDAWAKGTKDPMVEPVKPYLQFLKDSRPALLDTLDETRNEDLLTRSHLALRPPQSEARHSPARLMIVDEAQDLAPAEWRVLLEDAFVRYGDLDRRVVLLGDLQQRVNLVPFSWEDIKNFATEDCALPHGKVTDLQVDTASYRMRKNIARAASAVFAKEVQQAHKARRASTLDIEKLPDGGRVQVIVTEGDPNILGEVLRNRDATSVLGEFLFLIHGRGVGITGSDRPDVFNYSIREAKGLEADKVIVHLPFGAGLSTGSVGRIDHDDATEFYTAVSRARDHVLLIIDQAAWEVLSRVHASWSDAEIMTGVGVTREYLAEALSDARIGMSQSQVIAARLRQVESIANNSSLSEEEVIAGLAEALPALARSPADDSAFEILNLGSVLAASHRTAFHALRVWYAEACASMTMDVRVAFMLFFGELAIAVAMVEMGELSGDCRWDGEWIGCLRDESVIQRERGIAANAELEWSDDYVEGRLIQNVIRTLGGSDRAGGAISNLSGVRPLFQSVGQNVSQDFSSAADLMALRRLGEVLETITTRVALAEQSALREMEDLVRSSNSHVAGRLAIAEGELERMMRS